MENWDLKQLHHFQAIFDRQSISHAASELGITQSALTKSLQKLEAKLELQLFHRHTRELVATEAGERLYHYAQSLLASHKEFSQQVLSLKHGLAGKVSLGLGPLIQPLLAEFIMEEVMKQYPNLRLRIQTGDFTNLSQGLLNHELDCILYDAGDIAQVNDPERFKTQSLLSLPLIFVAHREHPVLTKRQSPFEAKWALPKIPKRFLSHLPDEFQQAFAQAGIPQYEIQDMDQCIRLAEEGRVITATTRHKVKESIKQGHLKVLKLPFEVHSKVALYQLRTRPTSDAALQLIHCIERVCRKNFSKSQVLF